MKQIGEVRKLLKNKAEVEVTRISACGENCKGCASACEAKHHIVILDNHINAQVGDTVEIEGETKNILKYTLVVYGIPFIMLILGVVIGVNFIQHELKEVFGFLIGIVLMALGYVIVRQVDKKISQDEDNIIRMTKIIL